MDLRGRAVALLLAFLLVLSSFSFNSLLLAALKNKSYLQGRLSTSPFNHSLALFMFVGSSYTPFLLFSLFVYDVSLCILFGEYFLHFPVFVLLSVLLFLFFYRRLITWFTTTLPFGQPFGDMTWSAS